MRAVNRSVLRSVVATMLALVASPVLAQAPEEESTRAGLMDQARDTLATQSVAPQRSVVERALSWYDNQYLFAKLFGQWNGVHLAGGDFPAGAGFTFGIGYDKALTSADPDPLLPNRVDITAGVASSTTRLRPCQCRRERTEYSWLAR